MTGTLGLYGSTTSAYALYRVAEQKKATALDAYARIPGVAREIDYFKEKINKVGSIDELFRDRRLAGFLLTSVGLGEDVNYIAKAKRILTQQASDKKALMNVLPDSRYKSAASVLKLGEEALENLKSPETIEKLTELYVMVRHEDDLQRQQPAVPLARYFKAKAATISNAYDILGDARLRSVVTETLGLPAEIAVQPVETQAAAINQRLNLTKLQNPKFVDTFLSRYLIQTDQKQSGAATSSPLLQLFGPPAGSLTGINLLV